MTRDDSRAEHENENNRSSSSDDRDTVNALLASRKSRDWLSGLRDDHARRTGR